MKGFVQIIEVTFAAFLVILTLPVLFSGAGAKLNWERSDLTATGNSIFNVLETSENITKILNETGEIQRQINILKPVNVKYALRAKGTPKKNITVGCNCTDAQYNYAKEILTSAYINGRWVDFTIEQTDLESLDRFDALLFINYTDFSKNKEKIQDYLKTGKGLVAINATKSLDADFNELFNLSSGSGSSSTVSFSTYEKILKNFLGFGFDVPTPNAIEDKRQGEWRIWEDSRKVNITVGLRVEIEKKTESANIIVSEGQAFLLNGPDGKKYGFKPKKVWSDMSGVVFQALNTSFVFKDFSDSVKVSGNNIIGAASFAVLAKNGSAIWISDFPRSDEYRTLVKASLASLADEFYLVSEKESGKNLAEASYFTNLCCDINEPVELSLVLWYVY